MNNYKKQGENMNTPNNKINMLSTIPLKIKGRAIIEDYLKLKVNSILFMAEDDEWLFFVACYPKNAKVKNDKENLIDIRNNQVNSKDELDDVKEISSYIDLSHIFKIHVKNLKDFVKCATDESYPFLNLQKQLEYVEKITSLTNGERSKAPKLVRINKKGDKLIEA
ncbi:hypothetical protein MBIO_0275 [Mycoplasmopsis fermentans PG18]|uniref:Uncharacterized protein n=2 Tax=Mycoplasmopsis fermentans TaxID=2115 RepID=C4XEG8_MYCFP|nr:hypothetical protein MBIO_0275 [Mycoplasmopsis fermentans PG18]